ncbi:unnamed protein product [Thlaspi arvense]|uniref:Uncharacterized protein n=1 Tax=Thlaspi arvense TaxID=13288 RepID=A0AAU9SRL8_THLAR|nr:unnamed protein product [Thlaspi arvense]
MNPTKSEIFFGGYAATEAARLSNLSGFKVGCFPTRYLDLPLNLQRISFSTLQPFIERITNKLHSWTAKSLSFAEKTTLISSVIYGMVNFWSAVFALPKRFYEKRHIFGKKGFWLTDDSTRFSPSIRAPVSRAVVDGQWRLPGARSDEAQALQIWFSTSLLLTKLKAVIPIVGVMLQAYLSTLSLLRVLGSSLGLSDMASWIGSAQTRARSPRDIIIRLLVQAITYMLWKERNTRVFTNTPATAFSIRHAVDLRDRLLSFPSANVRSPSILELYFSCVTLPL